MKLGITASLVLSLAAACSARSLAPDGDPPGDPPPIVRGSGGAVAGAGTGGAATSPIEPVPADAFVVHEWGTFTSVNSSAGRLMMGLAHEEEELPPFVYGRATLAGALGPAGQKDLDAWPGTVNQKLETPVIYFYGRPGTAVRVRVDFPQGIVSQWYPRATSFGPELGQVAGIARGFMEWQGQLLPANDALIPSTFPPVPADDIWAPSRKVASLPLAVEDEREQFIFYRGVGAFELPFAVGMGSDNSIDIHNRSADASPAVFLLRVHAGGGAIIELGGLPGNGAITGVPMPTGGKEHDLDVYVADAQRRIAVALEASGLYADEARAMVDTWSKSYFRSYGLRILYVVPRAWTDKLLPIAVEPQPAALVRTLVGRVELLSPAEERDLVALAAAAAARNAPHPEVIDQLGRLAEPKLRRVQELVATGDVAVRNWVAGAVSVAATMP
jgi:hypothetical protein